MAVKSSFKNMALCLFAICLVCSALLAGVYALTNDPIAAANAAKNEKAIKEVLPENAEVVDAAATVEYAGKTFEYNRAYDKEGNVAGYAINVSETGFGGPIVIKVGLNAEGVIWNTKVLSQAETPGLGAKCVEPKFADQFRQFNPAEKKLAVKKDKGDIDAITASTITSRAYVNAVILATEVFNAIGQKPEAHNE